MIAHKKIRQSHAWGPKPFKGAYGLGGREVIHVQVMIDGKPRTLCSGTGWSDQAKKATCLRCLGYYKNGPLPPKTPKKPVGPLYRGKGSMAHLCKCNHSTDEHRDQVGGCLATKRRDGQPCACAGFRKREPRFDWHPGPGTLADDLPRNY